MPEADSTHVDAADLLALALRHLDDPDTRRPFTRIPTLDDSGPFRPFPALAIAIAGHVLSAWEVRTFEVERTEHRIRYFTATGGRPRRVFRACTLFNPELGTQQVIELCGHSFCTGKASAGPGSRCADHVGDPVPDTCAPDHWLRIAGEAVRSAKRDRDGLTEREELAVRAARAGVPVDEAAGAAGIHEWTVRALLGEPAPVPEDIDRSDDPAHWPHVLSPVRDLTAADVRHVSTVVHDGSAGPTADTVLARKDTWYGYERLGENGPFRVYAEDTYTFLLEWWQTQDHLPQHQLARHADERRRREMYEPPCDCGFCED